MGTSAIVKINNEFTGNFEVQTGVKQGDPLSATHISIAMDSILKKMELSGNISTRLRQCTAYADDILITARTTQAIIQCSHPRNVSLYVPMLITSLFFLHDVTGNVTFLNIKVNVK